MTKSGYIRAAFRSSRHNEAYIFINDDKYVLLDYAPGTTNDKILHGPSLVSDGFKSLAPTIFQSYAIDCAFDTDNNQAFIFHEKFCALIDYAPYSCNDKLISGPKKIADVFPFFKGTVFESGNDAAYRSTKGKEAYLFKGDQYARIDYMESTVLFRVSRALKVFHLFVAQSLKMGHLMQLFLLTRQMKFTFSKETTIYVSVLTQAYQKTTLLVVWYESLTIGNLLVA